ncbi:MAG: N-6 DNA methylase [Lentisphaeria bacterium]|nr:N-6 DNA methylase [Lentisphaeria bacterium]
MNSSKTSENMDINTSVAVFKRKTLKFKTEEDVRAETNMFLRQLCEKRGIALQEASSGHEVSSIHGGRADSMYSNVIIEYKAPKIDITTSKGISEVIEGRDARDHGLKHYLINFALEDNLLCDDDLFQKSLFRKIGVGFNGKSFIFARYLPSNSTIINISLSGKTKKIPDGLTLEQPIKFEYEIIKDFELGFKRLLLYLRSTDRSILSSQTIIDKFGPSTELCKKGMKIIYDSLQHEFNEKNKRIITLYNEWDRIFGDIYGEKESDFTSIKNDLSSLYFLNKSVDIRPMLFTIQTYYNMVLKLLVAELLKGISNPLSVSSKPYTRQAIYRLFSGKESQLQKVKNFFEVQYFEWFIYAVDFSPFTGLIQNIVLGFEHIEATASILKPEIVEDVFREVYDSLMPRSVRHLLGEYYTPGWLVEFVLDQANYNGDPSQSLLDPACGSGSFVTHAIKRFILANQNHLSSDDLIQGITTKIVGYDINPITVITAQANYILALGDLSVVTSAIYIPIYMCDSVLVPTVHAKQKDKDNAIIIRTIAGTFRVPVFADRQTSDLFLKELSSHVENYTFEEFIDYLQNSRPEIDFSCVNIDVAHQFYEQVLDLHFSSQDGFWGTILKNAFAPLFARSQFDIVVGNPPWIAWKAMSDTYRKQTLDIWLSYGIFEKNAYDKITTHDDFAMAVTYVAIDHYCKKGGELVFVLPQTFLKAAKGGEGFRKFSITRDGQDIPFAVTKVFDMLEIQPFRGFASNRASVIKFIKNAKMQYPFFQYWVGHLNDCERVNYADSYKSAMAKIVFEQNTARPIDSHNLRSPWLTMPVNELAHADNYLGHSAYKKKARKGIEPCGAKGIYLVDIIAHNPDNHTFLIKNLIDRSRLQSAKDLGVHAGYIEDSLIYPLVGGRNIAKWGIKSHLHMVVPHDPLVSSTYKGISETILKTKYPFAYEWLYYFHDLLLDTRIRNAKFFNPDQFPWYRLDNVGPYTWKPYHLVWREQNKKMVACVISTIREFNMCKVVVTDSKVLSCAFDNCNEAHYLAAIINAPIIANIIESYTIDTQRGVDVLDNISFPQFSSTNKIHMQLAQLSHSAHKQFSEGETVDNIDGQLNKLVEQLFN